MFSGTILGIGIWLIVDPKSYEPSRYLDTYNVIHAAYMMIATGGFTIFLSFFGIAAAMMHNSYMLVTVSEHNNRLLFSNVLSTGLGTDVNPVRSSSSHRHIGHYAWLRSFSKFH